MTGPEADRLGARLALHLRKGDFEVCRHILESAEEATESQDGPTAIAELNLDLRYVNLLEKEGFIYVSDLDGVDIMNLLIGWLGEKGRYAILRALQKHQRAKVLERTQQLGEAMIEHG